MPPVVGDIVVTINPWCTIASKAICFCGVLACSYHLVDRLRRCCSILQRDERKVCQRVVAVAKVRHNLGRVGAVCKHVQKSHIGDEVESRENLLQLREDERVERRGEDGFIPRNFLPAALHHKLRP